MGALTLPEAASVANTKEPKPALKTKAGCGKKSFRSALSQAAKQGYAKYKGQTLWVRKDYIPTAALAYSKSSCANERLECISWNSGGLSAELSAELFKWLEEKNNLGFFSIQETHWGLQQDWSTESWHLLHSSTGKYRSGGILFGMSTRHVDKESVKWREIVEGRLIHVRFVFQKQQFDVISIYQHAMTFSGGEQRKEIMQKRRKFWQDLEKLLSELPLRSSVVLMGDFNTTLEPLRKVAGYGIKLGSQEAEVVEDRRLLLGILQARCLCALNTWGKAIATYEHPQGSSQIDYICSRHAFSDSVAKQCGPCQSPVAAWRSSGHKPILASIPVNWKPWKQKPQYSLRSPKLSVPEPALVAAETAPTLDRMSQSLQQHSRQRPSKPVKPALRDLDVEIRHLWSKSCAIMKKGQIGILLGDCFRALKQQVELQKAHRILRKAARDRRREQTLALLEGAEAAAKARDSKQLFQYVRLLSPKGASKRVHLRGAKGELIDPSQECTMLADYARALFRGATFTLPPLDPLPEEWFSCDAWHRAFSKLRAGRAVPSDSASVESWKRSAELFSPALSKIACSTVCRAQAKAPQEWCTAQLIWIAKPSKTPSSPENLRSLGLMAPHTKAFLHILKEKADPFVQAKMAHYPQFAYRRGTSTYDPILRASARCHKVRALLENHRGDLTSKLLNKDEAELKGGIMCSLDLSKAFDMVSHEAVYEALISTNMPRNLAGVLVDIHQRTTLKVVHGGRSESIETSRGLRQGCPVAPMLYAAWVCHLCESIDEQLNANFSSEHMSIFADDKHLFWEINSKAQMHKAVS